ncbi:superoxide dismutase family protein [Paenibacillus sp. NPDC058071]|uniref:superoxide dismutase family protein n=1 Tax=Paenibacillus sp. NPDC058071 TaxID=3346326 RepID=UPI0036DB4979
MKQLLAWGAIGLLTASTLLPGTAGATPSEPAHHEKVEVKVNLINTKGDAVGDAVLTEQEDGVHIRLKAKGLSKGAHGIHFHNVGKCEPPAFESAGPHFNPTAKEHGFKNPKGFHLGDLPNIESAKNGTVETEIITKNVTLHRNEPNSLLQPGGTALVIHEKADDYTTDPAGNSGNRIVCGTIQ